ncbi:MAG TPA: UvrD-helicase domain-containing protein, partial [Roseiflexaceae bacterium]|nr:UvrD-helicase domain-containing protein [Roseiflexaceae bacterium]
MAGMFPNQPFGLVRPEVARLFRVLKRLPDAYAVWVRSVPAEDNSSGPDFWVRRADGRSALICVAAETAAQLRNTQQASLFEQQVPPGTAAIALLNVFRAQLPPTIAQQLPGLVLFPHLATRDRVQLPDPPHGIVWGTADQLGAGVFESWLEQNLGAALDSAAIDTIRRIFTPEIVIPAELTVRRSTDRGIHAGLTDYLLSYNQEWILKHDLHLSSEAEPVHDNLQLQLVSGVAGSGKSLVLLYRARLLRDYFPTKRILVLTHNRPLIHDLAQRFARLTGRRDTIEWRTFHSWCHAHWPAGMQRFNLVKPHERRSIMHRIRNEYLHDTTMAAETFQDEIDWLKDRVIGTREEYLTADRSGRGFGLNETMRQRVYDAMLAYQRLMRQRDLHDYGDVPRRIWSSFSENPTSVPQYDFVLIDEAQFFAPIWFEIVKQILKPNGHLFMVADPTQGFLKRRQSWLASGLKVRGRSHLLGTCYRTTREILSFATRFYQQRLPADDEAITARNHQQALDGETPQLVTLGSEQDEISRIIAEIRQLLQRQIPPEHILVLHAESAGAIRIHDRLRAEFGAELVINPRHQAASGRIRVCPIDAATGLESPIVLLMGTHHLIEAEQSV